MSKYRDRPRDAVMPARYKHKVKDAAARSTAYCLAAILDPLPLPGVESRSAEGYRHLASPLHSPPC